MGCSLNLKVNLGPKMQIVNLKLKKFGLKIYTFLELSLFKRIFYFTYIWINFSRKFCRERLYSRGNEKHTSYVFTGREIQSTRPAGRHQSPGYTSAARLSQVFQRHWRGFKRDKSLGNLSVKRLFAKTSYNNHLYVVSYSTPMIWAITGPLPISALIPHHLCLRGSNVVALVYKEQKQKEVVF